MDEEELGAGVQVIHKGRRKKKKKEKEQEKTVFGATEAKGWTESSKYKLYVKDG